MRIQLSDGRLDHSARLITCDTVYLIPIILVVVDSDEEPKLPRKGEQMAGVHSLPLDEDAIPSTCSAKQ